MKLGPSLFLTVHWSAKLFSIVNGMYMFVHSSSLQDQAYLNSLHTHCLFIINCIWFYTVPCIISLLYKMTHYLTNIETKLCSNNRKEIFDLPNQTHGQLLHQ